MSTTQPPSLSDRHMLFDALTLVSYLKTEIGSARLSNRCPTLFALECLDTLQFVLSDEYEKRFCMPYAKQAAAPLIDANVEISTRR